MIQFQGVSYAYPGRKEPALEDIVLSLSAGERVCIAGGNGSGKTTLAFLLGGMLTPTGGRIRVNGREVARIPQGLAALSFQNPDDQFVASVVEKEIAFGLELQNKSQVEMELAIAGVLARFEIEPLGRRLVQSLSGGEKQKVALGALTVSEPRALILDEPDSFLDADGKAALESTLAELNHRCPDLIEIRIAQEVETMRRYDRLIILQSGRVAADGPPQTILDDISLTSRAKLVVTGIGWSESSADIGPPEPYPQSRLVIENLVFGYETGRTIINNLNFTMKAGEVVGVAGPTGSGKSTLGLLICGLLSPTSGRILFEQSGKAAGCMGTMALQQPERQFFLPTCAQEVSFGPEQGGRRMDDSEINRLLETVGLPAGEFAGRDPLTLSTGEQRRLAFAVMLALKRPFVIFDEPTAGLDAEGIARFELLLKRLASRGTGVLVVSHDHGFLERICERRLLLG